MINILDIWNVSNEKAEEFVKRLSKRGFLPIEHFDIHVVLLILFGQSDLLSKDELYILNNESFIESLKNSTLDHNQKLIQCLFYCEPTISLGHIANIESLILNDPSRSLYEMTQGVDMSAMCQNDRDGNDFYDQNGHILNQHNIFHVNGNCYNIDSLFDYIQKGGVVDLPQEYITRFFKKKIDLDNRGLYDKQLSEITFHHEADLIVLTRNNLQTCANTNFPDNTRAINLSYNPLVYLECKFPKELTILDVSNTNLRVIINDELPEKLHLLTCKECSHLNSIELEKLSKLKTFIGSNLLINSLSNNNFNKHISRIELSICKHLKHVIFNDINLKNLTLIDCQHLKEVKLNECINIQKIDLSKCNNLITVESEVCHTYILNETFYSNITDDIVPQSVKYLVIKDNNDLVKLSLMNCLNLVSIDITGCKNLKQLQRNMFASNFTKIDVICDENVKLAPRTFFNRIIE